MGVPVYFKTLVSEHSDTILIKGSSDDDINFLFLDLNCLIHPCCRDETDESKMIQNVLSGINTLIEHTSVTDLLYIAIDGIAPKGKMKQQKERRYKGDLERQYSPGSWNTNAISPGTIFMEKLNIKLKTFVDTLNINTILSDSDERGEGEHKILDYIKSNELPGRICIYGLDADLIMLSLVSRKDNIYLLRERTEYNIEDTNEEYIYLKIDTLKEHIIQSLKIDRIINSDIIIDDYIFMCFLLGNDFINHIPSLSLRYQGLDTLLNTYSKLQNRYQGYYQLINNKNKKNNSIIHLPFFKEFIQELATKEPDTINRVFSIRKRQQKKVYNEHSVDFTDFKKFIGSNKISLKLISQFKSSTDRDVTKMIENLPLLYSNNEDKIIHSLNYNKNLCQDYFNSLVWTTHYYFNKCINWSWETEYNVGPILGHFNKFLKDNKIESLTEDNIEYTNEKQLSYIFPPSSHHLHKYNIDVTGEYEMIPKFTFNRYLWECHLNFIKI